MDAPRTAATVAEIQTLAVSPAVRPELLVSGARGSHDRSDFLLVRVVTSEGVTGLGEVSATLTWSGEDSTTAQHVISTVIAPTLVGQPLTSIAALEGRIDKVLAGNLFTKAGISMALWDALARTIGVPLAALLGGPIRSSVPVKCSLSGNGERLRRTYAAAVAGGFPAFKIKVGMDLASDIDRMREARELAGADAFIGLDANGGYSRRDARRALTEFLPFRPAFFEQPVAPGDLEGMRELRGLGLPIVADESVFDMQDLVEVIRSSAADVVSIYVGKSGGPKRAVDMATVASAAGLGVIIGSNGELGIGAAAQLQVASAAPGLADDLPSDIIGAFYYEEDVVVAPTSPAGGRVAVSDAHGLGVELRPELLESMVRA